MSDADGPADKPTTPQEPAKADPPEAADPTKPVEAPATAAKAEPPEPAKPPEPSEPAAPATTEPATPRGRLKRLVRVALIVLVVDLVAGALAFGITRAVVDRDTADDRPGRPTGRGADQLVWNGDRVTAEGLVVALPNQPVRLCPDEPATDAGTPTPTYGPTTTGLPSGGLPSGTGTAGGTPTATAGVPTGSGTTTGSDFAPGTGVPTGSGFPTDAGGFPTDDSGFPTDGSGFPTDDPGAGPTTEYCGIGVTLLGDLTGLTPGDAPVRAKVSGTYESGTIRVTELTEVVAAQTSARAFAPPCSPPSDGWAPWGPNQLDPAELLGYVQSHADTFGVPWPAYPGAEDPTGAGVGTGTPTPSVTPTGSGRATPTPTPTPSSTPTAPPSVEVMVVPAEGEPAKVRAELAPHYRGNLCIVPVRHPITDVLAVMDEIGQRPEDGSAPESWSRYGITELVPDPANQTVRVRFVAITDDVVTWLNRVDAGRDILRPEAVVTPEP